MERNAPYPVIVLSAALTTVTVKTERVFVSQDTHLQIVTMTKTNVTKRNLPAQPRIIMPSATTRGDPTNVVVYRDTSTLTRHFAMVINFKI